MRKNKRSLSTVLICALALILLVSGAITVYAVIDSKYVAEVNGTKYENYEDAWSAVSGGGTVTMLKDWTIGKVLAVNDNKTVTVNMNGFMINRGLSGGTGSGEVFLVKPGAVLNINGDTSAKTEHRGTIQNSMWHYNKNGNYVINGALITGGYNSNGGGAIHLQNNSTVNITGVTLAGNASSDGAGSGAIRLQGDNAKLTVTDSVICYNKATSGSGGAISIKGEGGNVQIVGTKIHSNNVTGGSHNGGAIQIENGTVRISASAKRVSEISFNTSAKNGGAIHVSNGNLIIDEGTIIARNTAAKEGGAIYVNSDADNVEIKGIFSGNTAMEEGGAIYVNSNVSGDKGAKISNAEFLGNSAINAGGAIYVDDDDDITLAGKVIANGNSPDNLYVQKDSAIVSNNLTDGSSVGLWTSWDATSTSALKTASYKYFVSDKVGYEIAGDVGSVYYVEASTDLPSGINHGNDTYPIIKGSFVYNSTVGDQMTAYFYYSDGYFVESAKYYNDHLITMSSCVVLAASGASYQGEYTEEKAAENIIELFLSAGFTNLYVHYPEPEFYGKDNDILSTIGYIIASREITVNGEDVTLIAIAVRGGGYGAEWASNVTLGDGVGEAMGFSDAANQVEAGIYEYIDLYDLNPDASKFWISGFSRAAATSNLVAKRLTDSYGEDDVYAFCFEAPKGGVISELKEGLHYSNIHNVINSSDIVPHVGTTEMGFIRYGVDHKLPKHEVDSSEYNEQKEKMLAQLAAVNPEALFNDYFHEASICYVESTVEGWFESWLGWLGVKSELIEEKSSQDYGTAEKWNAAFIKKMQEYSLTNNVEGSTYNKNSTNWHGYRSYWSSYEWYLYEKDGDLLLKCYENEPADFDSGNYTVLTLEDSIANLMNFYYTIDSSKKEALMSAIDLNALKSRIDLKSIYKNIIGEWNGYSIEQKNKYFNELWDDTKIEDDLKKVLTPEEIKNLKTSFFVVADLLLDFVGDDYDSSDQDLLGTLVHNISNILQTHFFEVLCAWTRSYDSYYSSADIVSAPMPPKANFVSGTYREDLTLELTASNRDMKIYYTTNGITPTLTMANLIEYTGPITLDAIDGDIKTFSVKAIAVYNGLASEVATYTYTLNTNAKLTLDDGMLGVSNLVGDAYLILAEYDGDFLVDLEYHAVTNNSALMLSESALNFENTVAAYLVRDLETLNPLCGVMYLDGTMNQNAVISVDTVNILSIGTFTAKQSDDPDLITIEFTTSKNNAECLTVALFEKSSSSYFENALFFGQLAKRGNNTYSFTITRESLRAVLGDSHINRSTLILTVSLNGAPQYETRNAIYNEKVYSITYHLFGGVNSNDNPDGYTMSSNTVNLADSTKAHHTFIGWYDNSAFEGERITAIESGSHGDLVLYAKWQIDQHTVTYTDGVDDEEIFPDLTFTVDYGADTPDFDHVPERYDYLFVGWDNEIAETVTENVIYTAMWEYHHVHRVVLIDGREASCTIPGYKSYYECEGCGYFEDAECTTPISDLELWKETDGITTAEHVFTEQTPDAIYVVIGSGMHCQDALRYYYACEDCGAVGEAEWVSDVFGEHDIDTSFTSYEGKHYHVCLQDGCDYVEDMADCYGGVATCLTPAACEVCGAKYGTPDTDSHEGAIEWMITEESHMTRYTCCFAVATEEEAHSWDNECDADCNICGALRVISHSLESKVTLPTCTEGGYTVYTCGTCGYTESGDFTEAHGHSFKDATTEAPKTCDRCGLTEGEKLPTVDTPVADEPDSDSQSGSFLDRILDMIIEFFRSIFKFISNLWSR